jgi:hypothetical protein
MGRVLRRWVCRLWFHKWLARHDWPGWYYCQRCAKLRWRGVAPTGRGQLGLRRAPRPGQAPGDAAAGQTAQPRTAGPRASSSKLVAALKAC